MVFSLSFFPHCQTRPGMSKKLGGDAAWRAKPDCPKGYSMPYNVMLGKEIEGWGLRKCSLEAG